MKGEQCVLFRGVVATTRSFGALIRKTRGGGRASGGGKRVMSRSAAWIWFCKVDSELWNCGAKVLLAVKDSRLLLLAKEGEHRERTVKFLERGVASHGMPPRRQTGGLGFYHRVDLGLDTLPYGGHTTSLDSYWMGVPVLTLVGETVVGRSAS